MNVRLIYMLVAICLLAFSCKEEVVKPIELDENNAMEVAIEHSAGDFREPIVGRREQRKDDSTNQYVMEMGHDEIRIVNENVDRCRGHENSGQPTDDEHRYE